MRNTITLSILSFLAFAQWAFGDTEVFRRDFWTFGQGINTNYAASAASTAAKPVIAQMRTECDQSRGVLGINSKYGLCAASSDPMFCKNGCYTCPLYGTATCTLDTSGLIKPGVIVVVAVDADLQTGTQIVGHLTKGDSYRVVKITNQWVSLETLDGKPVVGWVRIDALNPA